MKTRTLVVLAVTLAFLTTFSIFSFAAASSSPRITQQIDDTKTVQLARGTRPEATRQNDRGRVADAYPLEHMLLVLQRSPEQEQAFNQLIDELNDKNSANFHQWLTAEEIGDRFGVAQVDVDTITNWLESHGFQVNAVHANRMMIDFSGTAGQLREAFNTEFHQLDVNGQMHFANVSDPRIPAALAPVIKGFASLNDFKPNVNYKTKPDYTFAGCASTASFPTTPGTCYAVTAQDNAVIYNLNPLWAAGITGTGQTIAVIEDTDTYSGTADWNNYRTAFGLTGYGGTLTDVHPGGCTAPGTNADDGEAALDVEMATMAAPGAAVQNINCVSGATTFGGLIALTNLVNGAGPYPNVVSVSYGVCEAFNGNGGNAAFYNTYQTAAAEGISVFGATGDDGPSSCSANFNTPGYQVTSLGISGWTETPFNVAVGGTDFMDTYFSKKGSPLVPLSTYWSATNSATYESAKSYIPEMPWNDSCANVEITSVAINTFVPYGATPATCNNTTFDTTARYLSTGAASGGPSNCATGAGGTNEGDYGMSVPQCQGYAKPSYQSGSSLTPANPVYGMPNDQVRDIPDVSLFAANGDWGHFETICWSDPTQTSGGAVSCSGAPSTWSGFGGTSVASPTLGGIQALINQKTGQHWGNPNPIYYQIAQNEYGVAGGTFLGTACNSTTGSGPGCVFNDVTLGDIDLACEDNGTLEEAHCYKPASTHGVDSTDNITAATIINGGSGYTSAPTCTIAGPSNNNPYKSPTGTTLWAGGTQAVCGTVTLSTATTTAKWTVQVASTSAVGDQIIVGPSTYTLTGASTTAMASALNTAINAGNAVATSTVSSATVTITAKTAGYAGNFLVSFGTATLFNDFYTYITNTTVGQGPNYVSAIAIATAGSGYQPETPITLTGGGGSGAIAVASGAPGTAPSTYQPAYGAAPGYDLATGLGTVNAYNLACSSLWTSSVYTCTTTAVSSSTNPSTYGLAVNFTATVTGNSPTGTVQFYVDGSPFDNEPLVSGSATSISTSTLLVGTHTVTATYSGDPSNLASSGTLSGGQVVGQATAATVVTSSGSPSTYATSVTFTATISGQNGLVKGHKPENVTGTVSWKDQNGPIVGCTTTSVTPGTPGVATCTTSAEPTGADTITGSYGGDTNHSPSAGSFVQTVTQVATSIAVTSVLPGAEDYGSTSSVGITALLSWTGAGVPPTAADVSFGGVGFSGGSFSAASCGAPSGDTMTCTGSFTPSGNDAVGTYTFTAAFSGDSNYGASVSTQTGNFAINAASSSTGVICSPNPKTYATSMTCTATINGENGNVKGRGNNKGKPLNIAGTVTWSPNMACSPSTVSGYPGVATCSSSSASSLPVGTDTITATYSGDSNHSGSAGSASEVVQGGIATTIDVTTVSPNSEAFGSTAPVSITAVLAWTGHGVAPTAADVSIGGSGFAGAFGTTSCAARVHETITCTNTYTPSGTDAPASYTFTAAFSGDTNYSASSSPETNNFSIAGASSTTSVGSTPNPSTYATSVTFTATVTGQNGNVKANGKKPQGVTGTVTWSGNTGCSPSTVSGYPGIATCTTSRSSSLPVGNDTVTATYLGDSNHSGSSGQVIQQVTGNIATSINVTSVAPSSEDYGSTTPVTITAVLSWVGNGVAPTASDVTISADGTLGTFGSTSCAPRVHETITCTNTYTPSGTDLPGSYTFSAAFSGDNNYASSSSSQTNNFAINSATSSTNVGSSGPSTYGQSVTFTATVTGENGNVKANGKKRQAVTGTVTWSPNTGCSVSSVSGYPGVATCTTSSLGAGADTVTATYSGDSNHGGSVGSVGQSVSQAGQTITFTIPAPSSAVVNSNFSVAANGGASGNPVTFTSSGPCSNVNGTYTMTGGFGICSVIANQLGNTNYAAAAQVTESVNATPLSQTITIITPAPPTSKKNDTFTVGATASSGLTVTFTAGAGSVCTVSGATYTMTANTGNCYVVANQAGNSIYAAAPTVNETVNAVATVVKIAPTVTFTGAPGSAQYLSTFTGLATTQNSGVTPTITTTTAGACSISSGVVTMKTGNQTCTLKAAWATNTYYLAATAFQTVTATPRASATTITGAAAGTNALKVKVSFTVDDTTSNTALTGSTLVTVTDSTSGKTCTGTLTAGSCTITFTGLESASFSASFPGTNNYTGSTSASFPYTVN